MGRAKEHNETHASHRCHMSPERVACRFARKHESRPMLLKASASGRTCGLGSTARSSNMILLRALFRAALRAGGLVEDAPDFAEIGTLSVEIGRLWAEVGRIQPKSGRHRSNKKSADAWPREHVGRSRSRLVRKRSIFGLEAARPVNKCPGVDATRPEFDPFGAEIDRCRPAFDRSWVEIDDELGDFGKTWVTPSGDLQRHRPGSGMAPPPRQFGSR